MQMINDKFMHMAIEIAKNSGEDLPIGAVLVKNNEVIAQAHNEKELQKQIAKHAEMIVIEQACKKLNTWRLDECSLYVTLEPCPMCAWAILQSRIKNVYFGAYDNLYGAFGSKLNLNKLLNTKTNIKGGLLEKECNRILIEYFEKIRNDNKTKS